ncbi:MAG: LysM peptidoglycan-binding domain-containing protein [Vibrio sp.]
MFSNFRAPYFRALGLLIFMWLGVIASANANTLNSIRAWPSADKTRVVMDMASEPKFSYFTLTGPSRLVVDLKQTTLNTTLPVTVSNSKALKKIRKSTPSNKSDFRLVFELTSPQDTNIFALAADGKNGHRLVIDFKSGQVSASAASSSSSSSSASTSSSSSAAKPVPVTRTNTSRIVVAIDPGHGGEDPGSIGPTRKFEKNATLMIAKKVVAKLNATPNIHAVLTRTGDYYVNLNRRSEIARQNKALLLVSIHADSFTSAGPRGASVFVLSTRRANTEIGRWVVKKEEQSQLLGGGGVVLKNTKDKNVSQTVLDLQFSHSQTEGNKLALKVIQNLRQITRMHTSKPVYASLAVLKSPDIPSILVETGFISNPQEEKLLFQNYHQDRLAQAISNGVQQYFRENPPEGMIVVNKSAASSSSSSGTSSAAAGTTHKVQSGESLSVIAQKYGTSSANIIAWNNLSKSTVYVGQVLKVAPAASSSTASSSASVSSSGNLYVVKSGDYLGKIAEKFSVSSSSIKQLNNMSSNTVRVGQKLKIPASTQAPATTTYTVQRGDFLGKIAGKFGVTSDSIRKANNLKSDSLAVGQKLTIPR